MFRSKSKLRDNDLDLVHAISASISLPCSARMICLGFGQLLISLWKFPTKVSESDTSENTIMNFACLTKG
jgi:hypothetical protein